MTLRRHERRLRAVERDTRRTRDWTDAVDAMLGLVERPALRLVRQPRHRARVQHPPRRAVYSSVVLAIVGSSVFVGAPDRTGTYVAPNRPPIYTRPPNPDPPLIMRQQIRSDMTGETWGPTPSPRPAPRSPTAVPSPRPSPTQTPSPPPPSPTPTPPDESCSPELPDLILPGR